MRNGLFYFFLLMMLPGLSQEQGQTLQFEEVLAIVQQHQDLLGAIDDVVIGQDVAGLGHDHPGAQ